MIRPIPILLLVLLALPLTSSMAIAKEPPPEGRTYFIFVMGLGGEPYAVEADCLTFDSAQACTPEGQTCLSWQRAQGGVQTPKVSGIAFETEIEEDGLIVRMEGQGRIDARGRKSSIAAVARAAALDAKLNFTFAGRQVQRDRCLQMVEEFRAQSANP